MAKVRRVVGIGSSAGGLEALSEALHSLGPDLPFAYIVAQHMSPDHESPLVDLLGRVTGLRVRPGRRRVATGARSDLRLSSAHGHHRPRPTRASVGPADHPGPHPVIDMLLTSLAEDVGSDAVAVILSGSGSDGSEGVPRHPCRRRRRPRAEHAVRGVRRDAEGRRGNRVVDAVIDAAELPEILARLPNCRRRALTHRRGAPTSRPSAYPAPWRQSGRSADCHPE